MISTYGQDIFLTNANCHHRHLYASQVKYSDESIIFT